MWLTKLTGTDPSGISTVDDLNDYIDRHLAIIGDNTPESKLIGLLLAKQKVVS